MKTIKRGRATLDELAEQAGREPGSIEVLVFGQADQFRDREALKELEDSGVDHVTMWLTRHAEGEEKALAEMEKIAQEVL